MKNVLFYHVMMVFGWCAHAQPTVWAYDAAHAKIGFSVTHFGISETEGKFTKFDGEVRTTKVDFSDAEIKIVIDVSSINTENQQRDTHLKSADYFDAAKYPNITFTSKRMVSIGANRYRLVGSMAMHGVTRDVELDVVYRGTIVDPFKQTKAGFRLSGTLDRTLWGMNWNGTLAAGGLLVGNEVVLDINIELLKK